MLPPPIRFDLNEWFILLNTFLGYGWLFFVPKRYPAALSVLMVLFTVSVAIVLDHTVATPPLDWYDIGDRKKYEWTDVLTYFMYTPYALLSVYLYDKLDPKGLYFTAYVIGWALLAVFFEWLAAVCHVFFYTEWNLLDSFAFYLVMTPIHLRFFHFLKRHFHEKAELHKVV